MNFDDYVNAHPNVNNEHLYSDISLVNIVYTTGASGNFLAWLILDMYGLTSDAHQTDNNEYHLTTLRPIVSRFHAYQFINCARRDQALDKLLQNKIIYVNDTQDAINNLFRLAKIKYSVTEQYEINDDNISNCKADKADYDIHVALYEYCTEVSHSLFELNYSKMFYELDTKHISDFLRFINIDSTDDVLDRAVAHIMNYTRNNIEFIENTPLARNYVRFDKCY